jgi:predicted membrane-bound mannosyltransferase
LIAAALVAVAPPAVYFSRYFVQETLLLAFTLGALLCGRQWLRSGRLWWVIAMGACAGLMQATKALAPLFAVAALVALWIENGFRNPSPARWRGFALALVAAAAMAALFYSSFGQNPAGLWQAISSVGTMFDRVTEGASGHEKPWWWYATLLTRSYSSWPDWRTLPFLILAVIGYFSSWRSAQPLMRFLVIYATIVAAVLSLTPYKTPWVVIHLVPLLALFAAEVYELPLRWRRIPPVPLFACAAVSVALLASVTWFVALTRASWDQRNPYAYVHSAHDVLKIRPLADKARRAFPNEPIRIIAPEYWPLPWYLRGMTNVRYASGPTEDCDGALVIVAAEIHDAVRARMHAEYTMSYVGLRPGVVLIALERSTGSAP